MRIYKRRDEPLEYIPIYRDIQRRLARVLKISITVIILVFVFVPTVEQAKWIVGGAVIYNMSQNEELRQLPENVAGAANRFLESIEPEKSDKTETTE